MEGVRTSDGTGALSGMLENIDADNTLRHSPQMQPHS